MRLVSSGMLRRCGVPAHCTCIWRAMACDDIWWHVILFYLLCFSVFFLMWCAVWQCGLMCCAVLCCVAVYCGVVCSVMCSGAVVQWYSGAVVLRCAVRCMHMRLMGDEATSQHQPGVM